MYAHSYVCARVQWKAKPHVLRLTHVRHWPALRAGSKHDIKMTFTCFYHCKHCKLHLNSKHQIFNYIWECFLTVNGRWNNLRSEDVLRSSICMKQMYLLQWTEKSCMGTKMFILFWGTTVSMHICKTWWKLCHGLACDWQNMWQSLNFSLWQQSQTVLQCSKGMPE